MVFAHGAGGARRHRQSRDDSFPRGGVGFHDLPVTAYQAAWEIEDVARNHDLADIVKARRLGDAAKVCGAKPKLLPNLHAQCRDAFKVTAERAIVRRRLFEQAGDRLGVAPVKVFDSSAQEERQHHRAQAWPRTLLDDEGRWWQ